jgi:MFS transporter, DHA2 family, multidrug resistance protein
VPNLEGLSRRAIWAGFLAMIVGNFMAILDIQIVASSLREIQAGVSASADEIAWVQTSYLIAEVIAIPLSGLLGRAVSMRLLFVASALGFTAASAACAFAWDINSLILFRALQGFLGGAMIPTTMAALFLLFPGQGRGAAIVLIGMVSTLAPTLGPTIGGWITAQWGWEWLFLINLAPGLAVAATVWRLSPLREAEPQLLRRLDLPGLVGLALFLGCLQYVLDEGPRYGWFEDAGIVRMAVVSAAGAILFFWRAFAAPSPVVDLRVFSNRNFVVGCLVSAVAGVGLYGSVYLTPLFLSGVRGYSSAEVGETMMVAGLAMFAAAPLIGRLQALLDLRVMLGFGLALTAAALWVNAHLTAESGFWEFALPQAMRGAGLIMILVPMTGLALGTLPPERVQNASGLYMLMRNLGGALGLAIINSLLNRSRDFHRSELATAVSNGHGDVDGWLGRTEEMLAARGAPDPEAGALAQLAGLVEREATVMAFNDAFLMLALAFAIVLPLILLTRRAAGAR